MKAIITVVGKDKGGIVAGVATKIAELGLNIDDISQTVLDEFFTMMAVVSSEEKQDFTHLRNEFEAFGQTLNVKINIQSAAIFDAMYNIQEACMDIRQVTETISMIEEQNFDIRTIT